MTLQRDAAAQTRPRKLCCHHGSGSAMVIQQQINLPENY
jgi:hypothetical protein